MLLQLPVSLQLSGQQVLKHAVTLLKFAHMPANFRAINSDLLLGLICFLNIHSMPAGWIKNKLKWSYRVTWKSKKKAGKFSSCAICNLLRSLLSRFLLTISHLLTAVAMVLTIASAICYPSSVFSRAVSVSQLTQGCGDAREETEGEFWLAPHHSSGAWARCLLQENGAPGPVLKCAQDLRLNQAQSPAPCNCCPGRLCNGRGDS